jgi:hypothetical protein
MVAAVLLWATSDFRDQEAAHPSALTWLADG